MTLEDSLINARKRWVEARKKNDLKMMSLWERVGKSIKKQIEERIQKPSEDLYETAKNIFGGKLQN